VDKLERWLPDELPAWLGDLITVHVERKVDRRIAARQALEFYEKQGLDAPMETKEDAAAAGPIFVRTADAWNSAYVVIDELRVSDYQGNGSSTNFTTEVRSLIAALVKGKPRTRCIPGCERLRWMFLGLPAGPLSVSRRPATMGPRLKSLIRPRCLRKKS
jgi:hypothetical protein